MPQDDLLHEADEEELRDLFEEEEIPVSAPSAAQASLEIPVSAPSAAQASLPELMVPLTPSKVVAAMQPTRTSASLQGSTLTAPMPPTSVAHGSGPPSGIPGTPTPSMAADRVVLQSR